MRAPKETLMTSPRKIAALALPLLLAACGGTQNRGVESVHQPIVARSDYVFDMQPGETDRLAGWLASLRLSYGDHVAVDGGPGSYAARDAVAREVSRYGLLLDDHAPVTAAPLTPGTVRVVVTRYQASVPGCPDWSRQAEYNFDSHTSSDFGCATNANLAAMVASPVDLVRGQPGTDTVDPSISYKAVETYRAAKPTGAGGLQSATSSSGGK